VFCNAAAAAERAWQIMFHNIPYANLMRIEDNDADFVAPRDMLLELMDDNKNQIEHMRNAHKLADDHEDVATASLLEIFIDEAEKRCWFLFEASRQAD
jgi:starvation-inducible DNA-binding protein